METTTTSSIELLPIYECDDATIEATAQILQDQWPRGGSVQDYVTKIKCNGSSRLDNQQEEQLPLSFVLVMRKDNENNNNNNNKKYDLIGHGRLIECFEGYGGNAAAVTYVIVKYRGQGYGTKLMTLLEEKAKQLGYHYVYLWTTTAINFYKKNGYIVTERVSLYTPCLKILHNNQINKLEEMLLVKKKVGYNNMKDKKEETTVSHDGENVPSENDVWLKKRLVEIDESIASHNNIIPIEERLQEIQSAIKLLQNNNNDNNDSYYYQYYLINNIPWQKQIGPSCGLAALRMIRDYYYYYSKKDDNSNNIGQEMAKMPSLLMEAQKNGYSIDGEIFNIQHLQELAISSCGLRYAQVQSMADTTPKNVLQLLQNDNKLIIIPYDSHPSTKRPCNNNGHNAHYGIIVGLVFGFLCNNNINNNNNNNRQQLLSEYNGHNNDDNNDNINNNTTTILLLLVQHGITNKLTIASWDDFIISNQQLIEMNIKKFNNNNNNNTRMNLCNQILICGW